MEELARLVVASNPKANALRTNVQKNATLKTLPNGRKILANPIQSQAVQSGPIFEAVKKMHPWTTKVTVNKNFASTAHRDRTNQGHSAIALFGPFTGGALIVQEPTGRRKITEKKKWHIFNGARDEHFVEPFKGGRWSVVAYRA